MVCIEIEYDEDGESSDNEDDDDDDDDGEYGDEGCGVEQLRLEQIELGLRLRFTDEHTHQCDCLDDHDRDHSSGVTNWRTPLYALQVGH